MTDLTPREIVSELDRFIIGQSEAKRAVAVALRNRWRHRQLPDDIREEVYPKNILMIGPTGVEVTVFRLERCSATRATAQRRSKSGEVARSRATRCASAASSG